MATTTKKPKGEPVAGEQAIQSPFNYTSDDELIKNALKNQSDHMSGRVMAGKKVVRDSRLIQGRSLDQQIADYRADGGDANNYVANLLEKYKKNNERLTQKDRAADASQSRPAQQKKKTASITGNQGIIGSMLNLGGNKLLGGN